MERDEIEGMFGNLKGKLSGYVVAYKEDMAMVLTLVKFLAYNMYVVYFLPLFWLGFGLCIYYYPSLTRIFETPPLLT